MALYATRPRRDEVRIGRGLPSGVIVVIATNIIFGILNNIDF